MMDNNGKRSNTELFRSYNRLRGIDMRGGATDSFCYLENMYVDYDSTGDSVESIPGYRKILSLGEKIKSIALCGSESEEFLLIHAKNHLYKLRKSERERVNSLSPTAEINDGESNIFSFANLTLIADGTRLIRLTDSGIEEVSSREEIAGCTLAAIFDGRLFLGGNPHCPSKIYYSEPIADGRIEFSDEDGICIYPDMVKISSLLPYGNMLWVFRSADDGQGAIALIKRKGDNYSLDGFIPSPVCLSNAVAYDNRIFYMSDRGAVAIEHPLDPERRKAVCISMPIAPMLAGENKSDARLTLWKGYVMFCFGERVYLADTRNKT